MRKFRTHIIASFIFLALWSAQAEGNRALAQMPSAPALASAPISPAGSTAADEVNYDVQIHLLVGANDSIDKMGVPQSLGVISGQLRASLPFNNYRVAATFLNRVKNGGNLEVNGVAGSLFPASPVPSSPTFYEFALRTLKVEPNAAGQRVVQIDKFRFTMRIPLANTAAPAQGSNPGQPVISYEPIGINTEVSIGEGVPTIVGTMTTGRSDESYILVVTVKPAMGH